MKNTIPGNMQISKILASGINTAVVLIKVRIQSSVCTVEFVMYEVM